MRNHLCGRKDHDKDKHKDKEMICNSICGNLLLSDQASNLEIWREKTEKDAFISISVFNCSHSTATIRVSVFREEELPVKFNVPPGNTLSATVDDAKSVTVTRIGEGRIDGKFCLDVCIPIKKKDHKDRCHKHSCKIDKCRKSERARNSNDDYWEWH
ncbi:S-Ena type endospore appendage [Peribacillus alkalitolerans]|uniref:S-Ena type endospore appendage n=1 Tax=Peribacillus alkalitolerans TaxID=1550385 RepID=UPI0013D7054C|nr:S-Ena type endospore appendage [Peribacillus alkalitolerans]